MEKILYKYYSPNALGENQIGTLVNKQFWFGGNSIQNDPYDLLGANNFVNSYVGSKLASYLNKTNIASKQEIEVFKNQLKQFVSCSFSRVATDRLMWAHYSQSYQGFCIAYSFDKDSDLQPVVYKDQYPMVKIYPEKKEIEIEGVDIQISECLEQWMMTRDPKVLFELIKLLVSIKSQEWVYEQEERIVEILEDGNGANFSWEKYSAQPRYLIFGTKFNHKAYSNHVLNFLNIWTFRQSQLLEVATQSLQHFDISIKQLNSSTMSKYYHALPK